VLGTPSPTLPRTRERERTEIADERTVTAISVVHSRESGNPEPQSVALGPRFRGDERSELFRGDEQKKFVTTPQLRY
jgi:hypothetical protein